MKHVDTLVVEGVRIDCYVLNANDLCLVLMDNETGALLHSKIIAKETAELDAYVVTNILSGTTDSGLRCLSIAVCEDTDADIPLAKELAFYVKSDNTVELHNENYWSDSETHPYYEYSENEQDFVMFKPERPNGY